ncbi:MAG: preprotein translocase subunit Tim44 [Kordiimonadales bacterium]|nr:MAG: preprotein translocase subunit Tim44 [Kordiimonadales bacterium]
MYFDIILVAMVAVFILLRLRSELGKKTGNEPQPPAMGRGPHERRGYGDDRGEVIDMQPQEAQVIDLEEDPSLRHAYMDIRKQDPSFDLSIFTEGAKSAYQLILEAFWTGDRGTLKNFLDASVLSKFESALDTREADELKIENQLLDVTKAEVIAANLLGKVAELTVHFTSEVVAVTRDKEGKIIEGDASDAVEMNDKWTFSRDVKSGDPSWTLVATSSG